MEENSMEYLIRLVQLHETFRKAEIEALAAVNNVRLEFVTYKDDSPFCVIRLGSRDDNLAEGRHAGDAEESRICRSMIQRSILTKAIYELWGVGSTYEELHEDVRRRSSQLWSRYEQSSFRFDLDSYQGKRSNAERRQIIESFDYLDFEGPIVMSQPEERFCIFEDWEVTTPNADDGYTSSPRPTRLRRVYLGRWLANGGRDTMLKYDLKKRRYISTTSMDSELALVTANLALALPNKIFYDPFVGTGSFSIACAHFGAMTVGSDIDGRTIRGTKPELNIKTNFQQYNLGNHWMGGFIADLTNSPVRMRRWLDGIVCDPPYGVREGLRVLGHRDPARGRESVMVDGKPAHRAPGFIPPKKPYSFTALLKDLLDFSVRTLVDEGRLCLWMPTANELGEEDIENPEFDIPTHPCLELVFVCLQKFNKCESCQAMPVKLGNGEVSENLGTDDLSESELYVSRV